MKVFSLKIRKHQTEDTPALDKLIEGLTITSLTKLENENQ